MDNKIIRRFLPRKPHFAVAVDARAKWTIHDEWMLNRKENQFNWHWPVC
ncbi:hypothetical protein [Salinisphaera sp. G21_0]|nr:hypothetical protein [Salinisphaera sp. G21_0]MBO9484315.1 hypothetical protein [Salinisphaera sp. G21_0]